MTVALVLLIASAFAQSQPQVESKPPVALSVSEHGGKLTFSVINRSPWRITRYRIITDFPGTALGSFLISDVKRSEDLVRTDVVSIPFDQRTGKFVSYTCRLEWVRFENGLSWQANDPK